MNNYVSLNTRLLSHHHALKGAGYEALRQGPSFRFTKAKHYGAAVGSTNVTIHQIYNKGLLLVKARAKMAPKTSKPTWPNIR